MRSAGDDAPPGSSGSWLPMDVSRALKRPTTSLVTPSLSSHSSAGSDVPSSAHGAHARVHQQPRESVQALQDVGVEEKRVHVNAVLRLIAPHAAGETAHERLSPARHAEGAVEDALLRFRIVQVVADPEVAGHERALRLRDAARDADHGVASAPGDVVGVHHHRVLDAEQRHRGWLSIHRRMISLCR
jgi:hypothetical protein